MSPSRWFKNCRWTRRTALRVDFTELARRNVNYLDAGRRALSTIR